MEERLPLREEIEGLPPEGGRGFNRLVHEKSPYLLQHARNPVGWYPWGDEAFARAAREDKPVFLSIGYSTCHWCHVMARESFENAEVARLLNDNFVAIKVDREERPDIDEIYMQATQMLTGRGGWPNSLWLMPDRRPWYAGTYFPREDRYGQPGFKSVLESLAKIWRTRREDVAVQAEQLAAAVKQSAAPEPAARAGRLSRELVNKAVADLKSTYDARYGGFGGGPKFPPHADLALLVYEQRMRPDASLLRMITGTLDAMARGGIRDHVGGGFHRYATDAKWFLPHFEKMLYDNALVARAYVEGYLLTGDEEYRTAAAETYEWVLREMTLPEGAFATALDAESGGEEGGFYVWRRKEVIRILGKEEGTVFCDVYGAEERGNFRDEATGRQSEANVLYLREPLGRTAEGLGVSTAQLRERLAANARSLRNAREERARPMRDDKALAGWNGLMIWSLAYGGANLGDARLIAAAKKAADFILGAMRRDGELLHSWREGKAGVAGFLDDYAFALWGLTALYEAGGEERYLEEARRLADEMEARFADKEAGGFFFTAEGAEAVLTRIKDPFDKAAPSADGAAVQGLVFLARAGAERAYLERAYEGIRPFLALMETSTRAVESLVLAGSMYLDATTKPAAAAPDAHAENEHLKVDAYASRISAPPGGTINLAVCVSVREGWHVNSHEPAQDYLEPTTVTVAANRALTMTESRYPKGTVRKFEMSDEAVSVYEGEVWVKGQVEVSGDAEPGPAQIEIQVHAQPCDERNCRAPETLRLTMPVVIDTGAATDAPVRHARLFERMSA